MAANDVASNVKGKEYIYYYKPVFVLREDELVLENRPVPRANPLLRFVASVSKRSYLLNQLNRVIGGRRGTERATRASLPSAVGPGEELPRTYAERVTWKLMERFIAAVKASGAKPVVVFVDGMGKQDRRMARYLDNTGAVMVHIGDHMSTDDYDRYHLKDDFHWNPSGHAIVADVVLDALISSGFVPREACPVHEPR